jgi:hypothetical protein
MKRIADWSAPPVVTSTAGLTLVPLVVVLAMDLRGSAVWAIVLVVVMAVLPFAVPQLLARGALWAGLLALSAASWTGLGHEDCGCDSDVSLSLWVLWGAFAVALLGLGRPRNPWAANSTPSAFQATLTGGLILGGADVAWLGVASMFSLQPSEWTHHVPWAGLRLVAMMALILVSLWGTVRLKTWGVLLGVCCNVLLLLGMADALPTALVGDRLLLMALMAGPAAHLLLQLPLLWSMTTGHVPGWARRDFRHAGRAVVLLLCAATGLHAWLWR